ncbi:chemotaxis protein MotC [Xanthobacter albus]|uniref:chemotaxis protein MotC n=1 Tax=Xanthobacter albus TaxID=3119929 RepID=UPI003728F7B2
MPVPVPVPVIVAPPVPAAEATTPAAPVAEPPVVRTLSESAPPPEGSPAAAGTESVPAPVAQQVPAPQTVPVPAAPAAAPLAEAPGPERPVVAGEKTPAAAPSPAASASAVAAPAQPLSTPQATVAPDVPSAPPAPRAQAAAAPAAGSGLEPVQMVHRLQRLQDSIAAGSLEGVSTQRALIAEMDQAFAAADSSIWQDPANARALVSYFLSGGSPAVLRAIITREPRPSIDEKLLLGTLLYVEGREDAALRELGEVDARKLPNMLGAQIALAQATLTVRQDPRKASELLDLARLLAPGTLVEEAALRREILVAAQAGDMAGFERLSRHYLYRFNRSAYADNFRQRFASAMAHMQSADGAEGLERLKDLLAVLDDEGKREMYLLVARAALMEGKTALAAGAALRARDLAATASRDAERAQVYLGAAQAVMPDRFQAATDALKRVDRNRLDASDAALVDAALATANTLRQADQVPPPERRGPAPVAGAPDEIKSSPAVSRAREALTKIDALLKAAPR